MAATIAERLAALGIELPAAGRRRPPTTSRSAAAAICWSSPASCRWRPARSATRASSAAAVSLEDGQAAARLCAINILAQVQAACGDLDRLAACLRLGGFVACTPEFTDHPKVINGASDLMVAVLGEAGRHARAAVGVPSLPFDAAVEVEGMFELR